MDPEPLEEGVNLPTGDTLKQNGANGKIPGLQLPEMVAHVALDPARSNKSPKIVNGLVVSEDEEEEEENQSNGGCGSAPMTAGTLPSPFQVLSERRIMLTSIFKDFQNNISEGVEVFYVAPEWIQRFLVAEYDENDQDIHVKVGPLLTTTNESSIGGEGESFYCKQIFDLMRQWYGLTEGHLVVSRRYVKYRNRYIIDLHPVLITPHVIGITAASASRISRGTFDTFQVSSFKNVAHLRKGICELFHINHTDKGNRLWVFEYDDNLSPPVILNVSHTKNITARKMVNLKKASTKQIKDRNLPSGHYLLEVKQHDGTYLMDSEDVVAIGTGTLGLNNLGNTCYMNSALQCLTHVPELTDYFLYHYYQKEINRDNPLGCSGKVAMAFGELITNLFDRRYSSGHSSFSPRDFKYTIGHFNSIFSDYGQQDSQELVAFLLDAIHEDLNRVLKKPYVEKPELPPNMHGDKEAIRALAKKCLDAHKLRNDSVIADLFMAMYKSTLICPDCGHVSITFDPYNQLTLPLPIVKMWNHKIKILPKEGKPMSLEVQLPQTSTYLDLKRYICANTGIEENNLFGMEIHQHFTYKNYDDPNSDSRYLPLSTMIHKQDNVWFYEVVHSSDDIVLPVYSTVRSDENYRVNNMFSIPFFIALSQFERTDFGSILKKMLLKASQLSTAPILSELAALEKGKYCKKDFPMIDEFMRLNKLPPLADDDSLESLISTASPTLRFDNLFDIKILTGSSTPGYGYSRYRKPATDEESLIWTPYTHHEIIKKGTPSLITRLNLTSKAFYFYTDENAQVLIDREREMKMAETESADSEELENEGTGDSKDNSKDSLVSGNSEYFDARKGSEESSDVSASSEKAASDEMDIDEDITVEPLTGETVTTSSDLAAQANEDEPMDITAPALDADRFQFSLEKKNGLVMEWDLEAFNNCFCDMADDEFYSGRDTSNDLVAVTNKALEKEKREAEEKAKRDITLYDCLDMFSKSEVLGHNDLWRCPVCKEEKQATKKIELWSTPDILIVHLKRFESSRSFSGKIDATIEFPIESLDLQSHIASENDEVDSELVYDLFAVDNHYGGIGGGHYTAYVKNFVDSSWYYFNDSSVRPIADPRDSVTGSAYLLFYRRRGTEPLGGSHLQRMYEEIEKERVEVETSVQPEDELALMTDSSESSVDCRQEDEKCPLPRPSQLPEMPSMENVTLKSDTVSVCESDDGLKRRKVEIFSPALRNENQRELDSDIDDI